MSELHSRKAEQQILGYCMINGAEGLIYAQSLGLGGLDFYYSHHRACWLWFCQRIEAGQSLEMTLIVTEAAHSGRAEDLGGLAYLSDLPEDAPLLLDEWVERVRSLATCRRLYQYSQRIATLATAPLHGRPGAAVAERLATAGSEFLSVEGAGACSEGETADEGAAALIASLDAPGQSYVPTGLRNLDAYCDGLGAGELWVLAGRSSMGKSVGAVSLLLSAAQQGQRVALASLEMPAREQHARFISQICGVAYRDMSPKGRHRLSHADRQAIQRGAQRYSTLPIHIRDQQVYSLRDIESYARRQQMLHRNTEHPLRGLCVDYLGLMQAAPGERRHEAAGRWIAGLKALAKELGIWVLCLAQINRAAEGLTDSVPRISNLADSTMVENTADVVILCYRRHYYDRTADPSEVDWIIGKQRGGDRGVIAALRWHAPTGRHFDRR